MQENKLKIQCKKIWKKQCKDMKKTIINAKNKNKNTMWKEQYEKNNNNAKK